LASALRRRTRERPRRPMSSSADDFTSCTDSYGLSATSEARASDERAQYGALSGAFFARSHHQERATEVQRCGVRTLIQSIPDRGGGACSPVSSECCPRNSPPSRNCLCEPTQSFAYRSGPRSNRDNVLN
jgi:hypothetical protein